MKIAREFSRFAESYAKYNSVQRSIAATLVSMIDRSDIRATIADIGCGRGEIYDRLVERGYSFDRFIAFDLSGKMLRLHPDNEAVVKICGDFDDSSALLALSRDYEVTTTISSSALQWSSKPFTLMENLSLVAPRAYFAIFTSGTFSTLHESAGVSSPIHDISTMTEAVESSFRLEKMEISRFELEFEKREDIFRYIKKSGVSGARGELGYREIKRVIQSYPVNYLEFEVLFCKASSKKLS